MTTTQQQPLASTALSATDLLDRVRAERAARDAAEVRILQLALDWAHRHVVAPPEPEPAPVSHLEQQPAHGLDTGHALEAFERLGLPELAWHAGASLGTALGMTTQAGDRLLRDALILSLRLPLVWDRVLAGQVPVWRARRIAEAAVGAPCDVATYLDQHTAPVAEKIGSLGLDRIIDAAMLAMYPEEREIAQLDALDSRHVTLDEKSINHTGIADLAIRGDWADLSAFTDTVAAIAALIGTTGAEGQHESVDVRRAMAVGILADPARALALLTTNDSDTNNHGDCAGTGTALVRRGRTLRVTAHLSEANLLGLDPTTVDDQQRAWLVDIIARWAGRPDTTAVRVQPIYHCGGCPDCDHHTDHAGRSHPATYQPTTADTAITQTRDRTCQFPYCQQSAARCDLDHRVAFDHDHPHDGGPTCPCNLTALCRHHHRLKTHARWTYLRIEPGVHLWHDPYGQSFLRTRDGTTDLTPPSG